MTFFNKNLDEILSSIKAYQSVTASQHSPSQNSPSYCTLDCLFTKRSLLILTNSCMFVYTHTKCSGFTGRFGGPSKPTKWIKKKAVSLVWLVLSAH